MTCFWTTFHKYKSEKCNKHMDLIHKNIKKPEHPFIFSPYEWIIVEPLVFSFMLLLIDVEQHGSPEHDAATKIFSAWVWFALA